MILSILDPSAWLRTGFGFWIEKIKRQASLYLVLSGLLLVIGAVAEAQQPERIPRIGYLASFGSPDASPGKHQLVAFRQGLRDLGYVEGKTIRLDYRYPKDNPEQAPELAADLVRLKVNVLIAVDSSAIRSAKQATKTVPIVMITNQDPVAAGFVDSLAVPGANVTGITRLTRELSGKRLELLGEVVRPNLGLQFCGFVRLHWEQERVLRIMRMQRRY